MGLGQRPFLEGPSFQSPRESRYKQELSPSDHHYKIMAPNTPQGNLASWRIWSNIVDNCRNLICLLCIKTGIIFIIVKKKKYNSIREGNS